MSPEMTSHSSLASQILVLLGHDPDHTPPELTAEAFRRCTRDQLLDFARRLGLTGVSKLSKEVLLGRVQAAFDSLARPGNGSAGAPPSQNGSESEPEPPGTGTTVSFHKFDLGPTAEEKPAPQNIPWG